jgi:hypothetical protein
MKITTPCLVAVALAICVGFSVCVYAVGYQSYRKDKCEWCGRTKPMFSSLEVHHIQPQHLHPELRDTPSNLVTLCRDCHFVLGHKRNWKNEVTELRLLFPMFHKNGQ